LDRIRSLRILADYGERSVEPELLAAEVDAVREFVEEVTR
jgi:hypothetical protein